jgi:uncharacterized protein YecT (DUF1311 family)
VIATLLLLASAPASVDEDCGDLPQQPMNRCLYRAFQQADAELNAQWKLVAEAMKARDADLDRTFDKQPGHFETLLAAQRAWLTYREKQCLTESFAMRGGSGAPMILNGCMERVTRERTGQLKSLIETGN